jgi:hypothetical protein
MNTVIEKLRLMKMYLENGKGSATKPKQITQSELIDHTMQMIPIIIVPIEQLKL